MKSHEIRLRAYHRALHADSIPDRHADIANHMFSIEGSLGWRGIDIPQAPECGADLGTGFDVKYPESGLSLNVEYVNRLPTYHYDDQSFYDDKLLITFRTSNGQLEYSDVLHNGFPQVIEAFKSYRAIVGFDSMASTYVFDREGPAQVFQKLQDDRSIDIDGRNNIFTLGPAHYWDAQLCQRALGYDRDEVIRRLDGKVPLVKPLMDGVYVVFNDDPDLTFEEFCGVNDRFKPILGLI